MKILLEGYLIPLTFTIFNNLKIFLKRQLTPLTFIISYNLKILLKIYPLSHSCVSLLKNLKVLLERYLLPLTFIISQELEDRVGKISYPTQLYYILRIWRFCWKDTLYHWYLLELRVWIFCLKDTLSHWHLLFFKNLKILLERCRIPLTFNTF